MIPRWMARWRAAAVATPDPAVGATPTFGADLASAGNTVEQWIERRRAERRLHVEIDDATLARLRGTAEARATTGAADRVLRHEFDLLGSGPFNPIDPERPRHGSYQPIDWYLDPVRRLRFPRNVPHRQWNLYDMRPANADVKYPWELARCQHWAALGQAYRLTRDERYALEIAHELDDFVEANPVGIGINWTCTMDVALRAVSWAIGLALVRDSAVPADFWRRAYSVLFDHGVFVRANLENTYEVTSNHFLSNVVGLFFLGSVFSDTSDGRAWRAFARTNLERELDVQVLPDGADFESSLPYHRLVAEMFLGCARLAASIGEPLNGSLLARIEAMVDYLASTLRPDGLMPQVGDADDGRLHVFEGYGVRTPQDPRHLFGPAAAMFGRPEWAALGGDAGSWETAWWGLQPVDPRPASSASASRARLFPEAGVAVAHQGTAYLLVTNGCVGTKGFGNHKHNDQLSFEYHSDAAPLIVDPGSFVYTSDFDARNRFRGTAYHNTLQIDGVEQNDLKPQWIFRLFESARAEHVAFEDSGDGVCYVGRHHGYERLSQPVMHERTFVLQNADGTLTITDRLTGQGQHALRWHFHLAPGVNASTVDASRIELRAGGRVWMFTHPALPATIVEAEYSPSYGVAVPCFAIELATDAALETSGRAWRFEVRR